MQEVKWGIWVLLATEGNETKVVGSFFEEVDAGIELNKAKELNDGKSYRIEWSKLYK